MLDKVKKIFDLTFWKFILVGIANTLFGTAIMFLFYNLLHFNYWISSASNYIFGSILSYFLNKNFTFQNKERSWQVVFRFVINISICYAIAYGIAKPLVRMLLSGQSVKIQDNGAMLVGMVLFVVINYLGQRLFVFKKEAAGE